MVAIPTPGREQHLHSTGFYDIISFIVRREDDHFLMNRSNQHPIYRKNLRRTGALFLLFALLCGLFYIPCYVYVNNLNQTIVLEHHQYALESNMAMMDASLEAVLNVEATLTSSGNSLSGFQSRAELDDSKLVSTRKYLASYFAPYGFLSNVGIVIGGEPVLDRYMLFYTLDPLRYYNFLQCSEEDYWTSLSGQYRIVPSTAFYSSIRKNYDAITVAYQLSRPNSTYLFVHYSVSDLYDLFFSEDMQEYCRLCFYHNGELLASNREPLTEPYKELSIASNTILPISVTLQIPDSFIAKDLEPLTRIVTIFSIVVIAAFALWIILFTFLGSKPFNALTKALINTGHMSEDWATMSTNDFLVSAIHQLDSKITDSHQIIETQRQRSRVQLLERALYRGLYSEDARRFFAEAFPDFPALWQLALVQYIPQSESIEPDAILAALSQYFEQLSDQVFCLPFNHDAVIVLFPVTAEQDPRTELQNLCDEYEEQYPISLSYQLGAVYDDPTLLSEAFQQIEYSAMTFQMESPTIARTLTGSINMHQLQTIYYALQTGDSETACTILENGTASFLAARDRVTAKYAYRALSYMLLQLELENRNLSDISIPAFNNERFVQLFREDFPRCFKAICQRLNQDRVDQAQTLEREILDYIGENYTNQQLSITSVTEHFHISAPTLQKRMYACVGKTFSAYVEELRMNQARKLLLTTNMTIQEISESIGYTNTNSFYKAYRRIFGESPRSTRQTVES